MEKKEKIILIVEDNGDDLEIIKRKLRSRNMTARLSVLRDGEEAIYYLQHQKKYSDIEKYPNPDLILLDIRMPKISGIEVLETLKSSEDEKLRNIPVVMLTVSTLAKDISESFEGGCTHYIEKSEAFKDFESILEPIIRYYTESN